MASGSSSGTHIHVGVSGAWLQVYRSKTRNNKTEALTKCKEMLECQALSAVQMAGSTEVWKKSYVGCQTNCRLEYIFPDNLPMVIFY